MLQLALKIIDDEGNMLNFCIFELQGVDGSMIFMETCSSEGTNNAGMSDE